MTERREKLTQAVKRYGLVFKLIWAYARKCRECGEQQNTIQMLGFVIERRNAEIRRLEQQLRQYQCAK